MDAAAGSAGIAHDNAVYDGRAALIDAGDCVYVVSRDYAVADSRAAVNALDAGSAAAAQVAGDHTVADNGVAVTGALDGAVGCA